MYNYVSAETCASLALVNSAKLEELDEIWWKLDETYWNILHWWKTHWRTWKWGSMPQILNPPPSHLRDVWFSLVFVLAATHFFKPEEEQRLEEVVCVVWVFVRQMLSFGVTFHFGHTCHTMTSPLTVGTNCSHSRQCSIQSMQSGSSCFALLHFFFGAFTK